MANEGAIAEQVVGQALRVVAPPVHEPKLHYWARDTPGSEAEVYYVIQQGTHIVPIGLGRPPKRVFAVDVLVCDTCGGSMRILSALAQRFAMWPAPSNRLRGGTPCVTR